MHNTYDVMWRNVRVATNHLIDLQQLVMQYPSLRFLDNPLPDRRGFITFSIGGEGPDIAAFQKELWRVGWIWKEPERPKKKSIWKRIFE